MARPRQRSGNLPAESTTFVGRRGELGEIRKKLATARLVSLVGPGGVGKTRLAVRAGTDLARGFTDGAWLVELGEVSDTALVAHAVLAALDLRDQAGAEPIEILASYLRERQLLLLIDNCEHVLEPAAQLVSEVLRTAPAVRVIATSREPLQVTGEYVVPIPPLELPSEDGSEPLAQLLQNEAVMLFVERAAAASGSFELTGTNRGAVVALCRRLDGLPLAIELAAVRTRVLSVEQILDRLSDRFALLTGGGREALPRHQTLRMAIDWSFDQLTELERILLRRLCVFAARFTLEDVAGVCMPEGTPGSAALDLVASIVDKSLVTREDVGSAVCYRLHETMREYASLKLHDANEEELLRERCLEHYRGACLRLAGSARYHLVESLAWADLEIDNLRAMLHQCIGRADAARGLDIAASLQYYWITHGTTEALRWLDQLLPNAEAPAPTMVRAHYLRAWLSMLQGDPAASAPWIKRAVALARDAGEQALLSESLSMGASTSTVAGDPEAARRYLDEAEAITPGLDDYPATIELLLSQSIHAIYQGDVETVTALALEGVTLSGDAGDLYQLENMFRNLGVAGMMCGDFPTSHKWFDEALQVARRVDNRLGQYYGLSAAGWYAAIAGRARAAAQLLGAADALRMQTGGALGEPTIPFVVGAQQVATEALGPAAYNAAFEMGQHMSREAALRLALGEAEPGDATDAEHAAPAPLAKRETEVARLVAEGLSNRQIGVRLFISEATVASHIRHIMDKLGVNSRSQIAVLMAPRD
ncbi:MAG TPA: LuxR C-terminal-related transcriptional regulator [Candidatus Acidoferrales bacterium]|nr:LuxR C-terminal-related transcriptional regulator [Candidatus Acidoferrales bacterium]